MVKGKTSMLWPTASAEEEGEEKAGEQESQQGNEEEPDGFADGGWDGGFLWHRKGRKGWGGNRLSRCWVVGLPWVRQSDLWGGQHTTLLVVMQHSRPGR